MTGSSQESARTVAARVRGLTKVYGEELARREAPRAQQRPS